MSWSATFEDGSDEIMWELNMFFRVPPTEEEVVARIEEMKAKLPDHKIYRVNDGVDNGIAIRTPPNPDRWRHLMKG